MKPKAILLFSGGLDSILSAKLSLDMDINLEPIFFYTVFLTSKPIPRIEELNLPLKMYDISEELLNIVKHPEYGYGKNLNPCIDCKIFMFRKAKEFMKTFGANFIISGEVLGERPMSQKKEVFSLIEKETELEKLILRPLSAKLLPPTIAEEKGWVDRERLFAIEGKSRKPQIELAKKLGIKKYPAPSGGCLLTNPSFSKRLKDLMKYKPDFDLFDVQLLKIGRHFRLSPNLKLILGRDEDENRKIELLFNKRNILLKPLKVKGPVGLAYQEESKDKINLMADILASYCSLDGGKKIDIIFKTYNRKFIFEADPKRKSEFASLII
jgi:tRNA U34 2-thiouridine synthase MnmA/TrmU